MDEEPHVHALHAGFEGFPARAFHGLVDERVLGDDELGGVGEGPAELLELLDGEALVVDASEEVAVLQLLLDGFDGCFLLRAGNGGGYGREVVGAAGFECGSGFGGGGKVEWVNGSGQEVASLGFGGGKGKAHYRGCGFHGGGGDNRDWGEGRRRRRRGKKLALRPLGSYLIITLFLWCGGGLGYTGVLLGHR